MFEFVQARESELNIAITMDEMGKVPMFRGIWLQSLRDLSGQPGQGMRTLCHRPVLAILTPNQSLSICPQIYRKLNIRQKIQSRVWL